MHPDAATLAAIAAHEAKESIPDNLEAKAMPRLQRPKTQGFMDYPMKDKGVPMT
jgi:hypothetical protein